MIYPYLLSGVKLIKHSWFMLGVQVLFEILLIVLIILTLESGQCIGIGQYKDTYTVKSNVCAASGIRSPLFVNSKNFIFAKPLHHYYHKQGNFAFIVFIVRLQNSNKGGHVQKPYYYYDNMIIQLGESARQ